MYSVFCAFALIFVIFVVPETKGRDLDDIAKLFIKNRRQSVELDSGAINKAFSNGGEQHLVVATLMNDTNGQKKQQSFNKSANGINGNGNVNDSDITKL